METIKDLWASVIAYVHERTTNPLTSAFAISWSLWNYKFFVLLFSELSPAKTFAQIDALYPRPKTYWENGLLYPALTAVFYVFVYPYITSWVVTFYRRRQVEIANVIKKEEASRVRTPKEYNDMVRRYEKELTAVNSELNVSGQKSADLQAALDAAERELASLKAPLADSYEEQSDAGRQYASASEEAANPRRHNEAQRAHSDSTKSDLSQLAKAALVNDLVVKRKLKETGGQLVNSQAVFGKGRYVFDYVITTTDHIYIIDPKYVSRALEVDPIILGRYYDKLFNGVGDLPVEMQSKLTVVVVVVADEPMQNWSNPARNTAVYACLPPHAKNQRFDLDVRGITFTEALEGAWMVA